MTAKFYHCYSSLRSQQKIRGNGKLAADATAENLTTFIEQKITSELENKSQILATKEDIATVILTAKEDIAIVNLKIEQSKSETIKWMFIFWVAQVVTTFGFILLFLNK